MKRQELTRFPPAYLLVASGAAPAGAVRSFKIVHHLVYALVDVLLPCSFSKRACDRFDERPKNEVGLRVQDRSTKLRLETVHFAEFAGRRCKAYFKDQVRVGGGFTSS